MIKFYIDSSHRRATEILRDHLWGGNGIDALIKGSFDWKHYGTELRMILIGLYAEGDIPVGLPSEPRVGNVSKKDKSLRIDIGIDPEAILGDSSLARKYLVRENALALRAPLNRRTWDFDFEALAADFERKHAEF